MRRGDQVKGFIQGKHGDDEIVVNVNAIAHARYSKTLGHDSRLVIVMLTRGLTPQPDRPMNVIAVNSHIEIRGLDADYLWGQLCGTIA